MKIILVGFAYGPDNYINQAISVQRNNWSIYAERHGYDCAMITELIDKSMHRKDIQMQKMLVFNKFKEYDAVIYVDNDIIINPLAPAFPLCRPDDLLRAVPHTPWEGVRGYSNRFSLNFSSSTLLNSGVMCLSDTAGYDLMEKIYFGKDLHNSHDNHGPDQVLMAMPYLKSNKCQWIDHRWNYVPHLNFSDLDRFSWVRGSSRLKSALYRRHLRSRRVINAVKEMLSHVYFLHFAGSHKFYIEAGIQAALQLRKISDNRMPSPTIL